jgi:hypothetical protein
MTATVKGMLVAAAALAWSVSPSSATTVVCGAHDAIVSSLTESFHEQRESIGLTDGGMLIEIFVSDEGRWTMVMSSPAGISCIIASGESWERMPKPSPEA